MLRCRRSGEKWLASGRWQQHTLCVCVRVNSDGCSVRFRTIIMMTEHCECVWRAEVCWNRRWLTVIASNSNGIIRTGTRSRMVNAHSAQSTLCDFWLIEAYSSIPWKWLTIPNAFDFPGTLNNKLNGRRNEWKCLVSREWRMEEWNPFGLLMHGLNGGCGLWFSTRNLCEFGFDIDSLRCTENPIWNHWYFILRGSSAESIS